jgi:IS5 family transposase
MPIRAIITDGTTADCSQASDLIQGFSSQALLADRGYDSNSIVQQALDQLMQPVIPPKKNRLVQRDYCKDIANLI